MVDYRRELFFTYFNFLILAERMKCMDNYGYIVCQLVEWHGVFQ